MNNKNMVRMVVGLAVLAVTSVTKANTLKTSASQSASASRGSSSKLDLHFSMGLSNTYGGFGGSFLAGVGFPISKSIPLKLGAETGIMVTPGVALPILFSAQYMLGNDRSVKPYIAASIGPVIGLSGGGPSYGGLNLSRALNNAMSGGYAGSGLMFAILMRPGLNLAMNNQVSLNTEVAFGGLTGMFYISPTVGVSIAL